MLLQRSECSFVVGLLSDFRDKLRINDLASFVDDDDSASQETGKRTFLLLKTVVLGEAVVTEDGYRNYLVKTFCTAEARLGEGKILRDTEDYGIVQLRCFSIEAAYAGSAYTSINAGEDVEDDTLTTEIFEVKFAQIRLDSPEVRSDATYSREFAREAYGEIFLKCNCCHCLLYYVISFLRRERVSIFSLITMPQDRMFTPLSDYRARSHPSSKRRTRSKRLRLMQ